MVANVSFISFITCKKSISVPFTCFVFGLQPILLRWLLWNLCKLARYRLVIKEWRFLNRVASGKACWSVSTPPWSNCDDLTAFGWIPMEFCTIYASQTMHRRHLQRMNWNWITLLEWHSHRPRRHCTKSSSSLLTPGLKSDSPPTCNQSLPDKAAISKQTSNI